MNLRLILTAVQTFKTTQEQYKEESEQFDEEHEIRSPVSKGLSHSAVMLKVIVIGLIMGDFDFLDELIGNKWLALMTLIIIGIPILILIGFMSEDEKNTNRDKVHNRLGKKRKEEERSRIVARREQRKKSNSLVDLGH